MKKHTFVLLHLIAESQELQGLVVFIGKDKFLSGWYSSVTKFS